LPVPTAESGVMQERLAVDVHRAGAALGEAAAEMRVVQSEVIAQRVEQRHVRIGVDRVVVPVHVELECLRHGRCFPPEQRDPRR